MRSEAIAVVYLQRRKNAKRIYASVVHVKANCDGYKEQGITFPSTTMQVQLLEEFYNECGISPTCLNYVEAHGTGTVVGDPEELNAIDKVFCKNRETPLLIESVKSNLGHSEPASGLCQIAKVIIYIVILHILQTNLFMIFFLVFIIVYFEHIQCVCYLVCAICTLQYSKNNQGIYPVKTI